MSKMNHRQKINNQTGLGKSQMLAVTISFEVAALHIKSGTHQANTTALTLAHATSVIIVTHITAVQIGGKTPIAIHHGMRQHPIHQTAPLIQCRTIAIIMTQG